MKDETTVKKRVPWHVTFFAGAGWFALCHSIMLTAAFASAGLLYLFWPKLRRRPEGDPEGPGDIQ